MIDVAIIGGGIIGAATAYRLSQYKLNVALFEKENDIATGATRANSAIIHAGYDPKPGTLMARLNVAGAAMTEQLCADLDVEFDKIGSLVLAFSQEELQTIRQLYERGIQNGLTDQRLLNAEEVHRMEPEISDRVLGALYAPSAGIINPWEYALAMAETAVVNGASVYLEHKVTAIISEGSYYRLITDKGDYETRYVINAAGTASDVVHNMIAAPSFCVKPSRGEYYLMDKAEGNRAKHVLFQCPSSLGKGVLVTPTVGGNLIVGPTAISTQDANGVGTTADGLESIRAIAAKSIPTINYRNTIRTFAGVRANTDKDDFIIAEAAPRFIDLAGIKSPGLSSAPAIALEADELLRKAGLELTVKSAAVTKRRRIRFSKLSPDEKAEVIRQNPLYGRVICRCETITEGEIVDAIHSPIPPRTVDGIKRRTGAGLGRCQGGFCGPRVLEILARELNVSPLDILKDTAGSYILSEETKKGEQQ